MSSILIVSWFERTVRALSAWGALGLATALGQEAPTVRLAEVPERVSRGEQPRIRAVVTAEIVRGYLFVQDSSGPLCLRLLDSKPFTTGDLIEATVQAYDARDFWHLADTATQVGTEALPEPEAVAGREFSVARHHARSVTVTGRINSSSRTTRSYLVDGAFTPLTYDVLEADCDGLPVRFCFDVGTDLRQRCPEGSRVRFTGSARVHDIKDWGYTPYVAVWVEDPRSVEVLALPGVFERREVRRALTFGGLSILALALFAGGGVLLHRRRLRTLRRRYEELERRVAERTEELSEALERERKLGLVKSDFVSLVSHEFRTPLGVIMSATEVLKRYFDRLEPEKRERHLEMICNATSNLAAMIEEVLLLGQMDEGKVDLTAAPLDLERLCRVVSDEMNSATKAVAPIRFRAATPLDGASGDESLLRHILSNLLSNACKYSRPREEVRFEVSREGDLAKFVIEDRGIGIPETDRDRLFASFSRGSNVGALPGTGLGLVIANRCANLHGGSLTLDSTPGIGTTATVLVPLFSRSGSSVAIERTAPAACIP